VRGVTEDAQPAQITATVEYRAPKTFVRSGPVGPPPVNSGRAMGATYIGHVL
jgi:hypothetical protein